MSWLARSIANTLRLDDDRDAEEEEFPDDPRPRSTSNDAEDRPHNIYGEGRPSSFSDGHDNYNRGGGDDIERSDNQGRGVKEDLSELRDSLTRQMRGVASFLAPPPPPPPPPLLSQRSGPLFSEFKSDRAGYAYDDDEEDDESVEYDRRQSDQFGESAIFYESGDYFTNSVEGAVGITEEVLAFARNIAHHPETWLDFPLVEEEEFDDFDMSDAQYKHALAVELLAPRLAALRIELCPAHMSQCYFWTVYFVLLHSRLNKHDADLLSSPKIAQARAMWIQELQKQSKESSWLGTSTSRVKESADSPRENFIVYSYEDAQFGKLSDRISPFESTAPFTAADQEVEKQAFAEVEFVDKSVIKEDLVPKFQDKEIVVGPSIGIPEQYNDDDDDWLKDDPDLIGLSGSSTMVNEEDISFSDLEDDIDCTMPVKSKISSTGLFATNRTS